jgi:long-chain acyl-CoA synthetase
MGSEESRGVEYRTATAMLREWAAATPGAPMLTLGDITLTWAEVYGRARQVGRSLTSAGVTVGDRVAFLDKNGIEFFEAFFGCALMGA